MKILFFHPSFPGQFIYLAPALVARGHDVVALTRSNKRVTRFQGVRVIPIKGFADPGKNTHRWAQDFEREVILAEAAYKTAKKIAEAGFSPDLIICHPGWGDSTCLKQVWPSAKLLIYCEEFLENTISSGISTELLTPKVDDYACLVQLAGAKLLLHFNAAEGGVSPTEFQRSRFPRWFREKITVIHDGVDTSNIMPSSDASVTISRADRELIFRKGDEIITYASRNFEPVRGYHTFIRAVPEILKTRPNAQILMIGGAGEGYGPKLNSGEKWREYFLNQVLNDVSEDDWNRVHFLGSVPHHQFIALLQLSMVHIYLTIPTMLSWSFMEAMAAGCSIVASDTQPCREMIDDGVNGLLVDFDDHNALANKVCELISSKDLRVKYGEAARAHIVEKYDLKTCCLPRQIQWVESFDCAS